MQILQLIRQRLAAAIDSLHPESIELAAMVRPTQDKSLGDFQVNSAMALAKRLPSRPPSPEVGRQLAEALQVDDLCQSVEVAGPGFINLRLRDDWLSTSAGQMLASDHLDIAPTDQPQKIVIDYSSPNVAKPMHVGHIRSCFIGDALAKILRRLGHHVVTDNHLGDWGTQFGMVIYGYRNFLDQAAFSQQPVAELLRVYRIVNSLTEYRQAANGVAGAQQAVVQAEQELAALQAKPVPADKQQAKQVRKVIAAAEKKVAAQREQVSSLQRKIDAVESAPELSQLAPLHPTIDQNILAETAKLHSGDEANLKLWKELLPYCMDEINRVYERLNISFDHVLGESFYHDMLPGVVQRLRSAGLAEESEGAVCLFLPQFDSPMIVQKKDGAYLYATTDLATIEYRHREFEPDEILYVVDFRQSDHFQKLFAAAALIGYDQLKLVHVSFGTVLDESGRPLKTRSGTLAGLTELLDDAVARAYQVVCDPDRTQKLDPPLSEEERQTIAETVGIGAIKYADLAHHRTSDYRFSLDKMVSLDGNTAAYVQYAYARIQGILRSAKVAEATITSSTPQILISHVAERELLIALLRLEEVLVQVKEENAPNYLIDYLYEIAKGFASMYEQCPVLQADSEALRTSRIAIITLAGRVLREGLALLGIGVVPRM